MTKEEADNLKVGDLIFYKNKRLFVLELVKERRGDSLITIIVNSNNKDIIGTDRSTYLFNPSFLHGYDLFDNAETIEVF